MKLNGTPKGAVKLRHDKSCITSVIMYNILNSWMIFGDLYIYINDLLMIFAQFSIISPSRPTRASNSVAACREDVEYGQPPFRLV